MKDLKVILEKELWSYDFLVFALLFGSFAEGRATRISDIDVGLYTERDVGLLEIGNVAASIEIACRRRIDIVLLNDLYKIKPVMAYEIVSKGQLILCRDDAMYVDFKKSTFLYYLDTAYLRMVVDTSLKKRINEGRFGERNYVGTP
ncbi:MAG: nucleotidyltransferase domain-containing protein [Nitrospirae bacterium]|nr:nucleotidyltransferase domain-containing protein [Nitrospirota bacterium]